MNIGSIAKVLLIGGGGITTVGALPNIVSSSSDKSSSNKRTRRSASLNQEGIKAEGEKIGLKSYCFYFDNEGIVGVPSNKGACESKYNFHLGATQKELPRVRHKWEGKKEDEQVLLVSGNKDAGGLFDNNGGERSIIGCFEQGWWGKTQKITEFLWGAGRQTVKVGAGYLREGGQGEYRSNTGKTHGTIQPEKCTNGGYESTTGVTAGMKDVIQKYEKGDENKGNRRWGIKYFGDLTWTLEW